MTRLTPLAVVILGALTAFGPMSIDMYLPAFPAIARELHAGPGPVAYTLAAFFVGMALGQLVYGPLADRFGRKAPLGAGLVLYVLASVGCAFAPSLQALVALRFLQALGGCAGQVIGRAMVRDLYEAQAAARIYSILMLVMGVAPILAPLAGGWVMAWVGWRGIFWMLAAFGVACWAAAMGLLPETHPAAARTELGPREIASGYGELLRDRRFLGFALAGAVGQAGMFAYIAGSPFVFITLHHVPAERYGYYFGLNALGLIAASQLNARLLGRLAASDLLGRALLATATLGLVLAAAVASGLGGFWGILLPLFGFLATLGFVTPNATATAMGSRFHQRGLASAMLGTVQFGAATLSGALVGALQDGTAHPMAYTVAACGVLALAAYLVAMRAPVTVP